MCKLWPWTWRYDSESRSLYDFVIHYPDLTWQRGVMTRTRFWACVHYDLGLGDMTHSGVMDNNCVKRILIQLGNEELGPGHRFSGICAPWPWRYDIGSRSWHTLELWTTNVSNIIQIGQVGNKVMARTQCEQTDRVIPVVPPKLFCGGINIPIPDI